MIDATAEYRSSYIGDVYIQNGQMYIVRMLGFETVNWGDTVDMSFKSVEPSL
jgi:hypothetical protein